MGHTPYGYRIENGKAVIDEEKAPQIRNFYRNYLDGMALAKAAHEAGIETWHGSAKRLLENRHYLGDDYHRPANLRQSTGRTPAPGKVARTDEQEKAAAGYTKAANPVQARRS